MNHGLPESVLKRVSEIFKQYPQVEKAVLFGSRAKGNQENGSDIDIALWGGNDLTLNVLFRNLDDLDELFLPYTFDLSIFKNITDSALIEHIQRVGIAFYNKGQVFSTSLAVSGPGS